MDDNTKVVRKTILDTDIDTFETPETVALVKTIQEAAKRATANESASRNSFPLRPSSALKSMRDLYYGLENWAKPGTIPTTDIEGRNCMLLNLGHVIEKHLVDQIKQCYKVPFTNQRVTYGQIFKSDTSVIELSGELDLVLELPSGEKIICDSKSSAKYPFSQKQVKDEHVAQLQLYLHSQWAKDQGIKRAWVIYYCKDDSNLRVHEFYYDQLLAKTVIKRFQTLYTMWENRELPAQEYVLGHSWQASYSNFRDYEWRAFEAPFLSRNQITLSEIETFKLPKDRKELLRFIVLNYGIQVVKTADGRTIFAIKKGPDMLLNLEDSDGFS